MVKGEESSTSIYILEEKPNQKERNAGALAFWQSNLGWKENLIDLR